MAIAGDWFFPWAPENVAQIHIRVAWLGYDRAPLCGMDKEDQASVTIPSAEIENLQRAQWMPQPHAIRHCWMKTACKKCAGLIEARGLVNA